MRATPASTSASASNLTYKHQSSRLGKSVESFIRFPISNPTIRSLRTARPFTMFSSLCSLPITLLIAILVLATPSQAVPAVTVYTATTAISTAVPSGKYTGLAAYDPTTLTPPTPPQPVITAVTVNIPSTAQQLQDTGLNLSIPQKGNFLGFSIELSIADVTMGKTPQQLKSNFLNYMANIQVRAGVGPVIRVGGNTQEYSTIVTAGLAGGAELEKLKIDTGEAKVGAGAITTPVINYSPLLLYTMSNITALVGAEWYFGLAFNQSDVISPTGNIPVAAQYAQQILGKSLRGLALGNEPDLYVDHSARPTGWGVTDYVNEFNQIRETIETGGHLSTSAALVGPSICCQSPGFEMDDIIGAGWLSANSDSLAAITVQHYPTNNCQVNGNVLSGQDLFPEFLNHTSAQSLVGLYSQTSTEAMAAGKELVMLEMNTASCGGFPGLSDSFGAAMWMVDFALQLAYGNFSNALMHVGGQNVYYNPFTPPPSNLSSTHQWTTGSVYYATLVVAETFGKSNKSQIVDLALDSSNIYHPAYAVYEDGVPTRAVLFNYISDPSGASTYQATLSLNGSTVSNSVSVRYLEAPSVSEQYNMTWAGQTMGSSFMSDGRLYGSQDTVTIQCPNGQCVIPVPAPSIALVFLTSDSLTDSSASPGATSTYATTVIGSGSATVDPFVLETSNGQNIPAGKDGSTSSGSTSGASRRSDVGVSMGMLWTGFLGLGFVSTFLISRTV